MNKHDPKRMQTWVTVSVFISSFALLLFWIIVLLWLGQGGSVHMVNVRILLEVLSVTIGAGFAFATFIQSKRLRESEKLSEKVIDAQAAIIKELGSEKTGKTLAAQAMDIRNEIKNDMGVGADSLTRQHDFIKDSIQTIQARYDEMDRARRQLDGSAEEVAKAVDKISLVTEIMAETNAENKTLRLQVLEKEKELNSAHEKIYALTEDLARYQEREQSRNPSHDYGFDR
jgi:low affinity Fe/Cu permease